LNKSKTLNVNITATYLSGGTEYEFDFSVYSGSVLQVRIKPEAPYLVLQFSTTDGSIILPASGGTFNLNKTALQLSTVRAGEYFYDMYLMPKNQPAVKRAFLSGQFTIIPNIST